MPAPSAARALTLYVCIHAHMSLQGEHGCRVVGCSKSNPVSSHKPGTQHERAGLRSLSFQSPTKEPSSHLTPHLAKVPAIFLGRALSELVILSEMHQHNRIAWTQDKGGGGASKAGSGICSTIRTPGKAAPLRKHRQARRHACSRVRELKRLLEAGGSDARVARQSKSAARHSTSRPQRSSLIAPVPAGL